jgi:hypothetical protein
LPLEAGLLVTFSTLAAITELAPVATGKTLFPIVTAFARLPAFAAFAAFALLAWLELTRFARFTRRIGHARLVFALEIGLWPGAEADVGLGGAMAVGHVVIAAFIVLIVG